MGDIVLETVRSDKFRQLFHNSVVDIRHNRRVTISEARAKNPSARLLSNPFSRLDENGSMSYSFMSNEYLMILMKKSLLPAMERNWICDFMTSLFLQTRQILEKEKELILSAEVPVEIPIKEKKQKVSKPKPHKNESI